MIARQDFRATDYNSALRVLSFGKRVLNNTEFDLGDPSLGEHFLPSMFFVVVLDKVNQHFKNLIGQVEQKRVRNLLYYANKTDVITPMVYGGHGKNGSSMIDQSVQSELLTNPATFGN